MTTTERPAYVSPRWIPTKDVAKIVRAYLKKTYPGVKFSVRSDSYSGGSAVRVSVPYTWTHEQERELWSTLSPWGSSGFDGMTDNSYSKGHTMCPEHFVTLIQVDAHFGTDGYIGDPCCANAEVVHIGASYVSVSREWQRPDGITWASGARKGDVINGWTVSDVRRGYVTGKEDTVTLLFADRPPLQFPADVILTRS